MWIKILCIEYILWRIPTIESTFDVANMVKTATVKDVPINNDKLTGLLNSCLEKLWLIPHLVVPLISARVPLISTRVSTHCQAILFSEWHEIDIYMYHFIFSSCLSITPQPSVPGYSMSLQLASKFVGYNYEGFSHSEPNFWWNRLVLFKIIVWGFVAFQVMGWNIWCAQGRSQFLYDRRRK